MGEHRKLAGYHRAAASVLGCLIVGSSLGIGLQPQPKLAIAAEDTTPVSLRLLRSMELQPSVSAEVETEFDYISARRLGYLRLVGKREDRPSLVTHVIQAGDTFWSIAAQYDTDPGTLMGLNPDLSADALQPGNEVVVATRFSGTVYRVQPGDTLSDIAARFGVAVEEVLQANDLDAEAVLQIDSGLYLPGVRARSARITVASRGDHSRVAVPAPAATVTPAETAVVRAQADSSPRGSMWIWPIVGGLHSSEFGNRWGGFHSGLDIAVPAGTTAVAARTGIVSFSGWDGGYGYCVILDHGDGTKTRYAHASQLLVSAGQEVKQGAPVIRVGNTGNSTGPHLHFEVIINGSPQNPRAYLP